MLLLKQAQSSTGSTDGFALFGSQIRELKSVAVASAVPHNTANPNWVGGNRD